MNLSTNTKTQAKLLRIFTLPFQNQRLQLRLVHREQCIHFRNDTLAMEVTLTVFILQAYCIRL